MSQAGSIVRAGTASGFLKSITGNSGGPVYGDAAGNINLLGTGAVTVTGDPGTNTQSISVSGMGMAWSTIAASQTLAVNRGYICTGGAGLSLLLPPVSALGDMIEVTLDGSTSFTITQGAGQSIRIGNTATTGGVGGSIASTQQGDTIRLVCQTANLKWNVLSCMGNPTIV